MIIYRNSIPDDIKEVKERNDTVMPVPLIYNAGERQVEIIARLLRLFIIRVYRVLKQAAVHVKTYRMDIAMLLRA